MTGFRRLGQPIGDFNHFDRFGSGQIEGYKMLRGVTFEAGQVISNPTGFDSVAGAGAAQLTVQAAAALVGLYGLHVNIADANARRGYLDLPNLKTFQLEFFIDINSLSMANNDTFDLLRSGNAAGINIFLAILYTLANSYQIRFIVRDDAGANMNGDWISLPDSPSKITFQWKAATAVGANNGMCHLFVNGVEAGAGYSAIDNDTDDLNYFIIGSTAGTPAGTSGPFFLDEIFYAGKLR